MADEHVRAKAHTITITELEAARHATGPTATGFVYPAKDPVFYVKFGNRPKEEMLTECRMQQFAHDAIEGTETSQSSCDKGFELRIPEIFRILETDSLAYVLMEFVQGTTLNQMIERTSTQYDLDRLHDHFSQAAKGIQKLFDIRLPPGTRPGSPGHGVIRHPVFKDGQAAAIFDTMEELDEHMNRVCSLFPSKSSAKRHVTLEPALHLVYSDLYPENFIFTPNNQLYIVDFEHASFLPPSFLTYALIHPFPASKVVASRIRDHFQLPTNNLDGMQRTANILDRAAFGFGLENRNSPRPGSNSSDSEMSSLDKFEKRISWGSPSMHPCAGTSPCSESTSHLNRETCLIQVCYLAPIVVLAFVLYLAESMA